MKQTTTVNANNNAIIHLLCAIANTNVANLIILATINNVIRNGPTKKSSTNSFPVSKHNHLSAKRQSIEHTLTTGVTHQYFNIKFDISFIFKYFRNHHFSSTQLTHTSSTRQLSFPFLLSFIELKTTNTLSVRYTNNSFS